LNQQQPAGRQAPSHGGWALADRLALSCLLRSLDLLFVSLACDTDFGRFRAR